MKRGLIRRVGDAPYVVSPSTNISGEKRGRLSECSLSSSGLDTRGINKQLESDRKGRWESVIDPKKKN